MTEMLALTEVRATASSVAIAVLPLAVLFITFQILLLKLPHKNFRNILTGTPISAAGLFLFLLGVSIGFLPSGGLSAKRSVLCPRDGFSFPSACLSDSSLRGASRRCAF